MFYVYILQLNQNGSYYVGSCKDVDKRLGAHNLGLIKSTKRYIPWDIVHTEEYPDLKATRQRELQIKSWKKRSAIERLIRKHSKFK